MARQPTPEQLAALQDAHVRERRAHADLAKATYEHTVAQQELATAIETVLYGPLADDRPTSQNGHTVDTPGP